MKKRLLFSLVLMLFLGSCTIGFNFSNSNSNSLDSLTSVTDKSTPTSAELPSNQDVNSTSLPNSSGNVNDDEDYRKINTHDEDRAFVCPNDAALTYQDLFDLHNKVTITIDISTKQLLKLKEDFNTYEKSDIYRIADKVKFEIVRCAQTYSYEFEEVGIRLKGNTSRIDPVDNNGNLINASHYKLSFTELFDDATIYGNDAKTYTDAERLSRKERSLLGLEKLDLKWNRTEDTTHIKEIYSYEIYRANGILTPYASLAKIKVNKENTSYDLGVYSIVETVDKKFIKRHLDEEQEYYNMSNWNAEKVGLNGVSGSKYGDLYKASYGKGEGSGVPDMTFDSFSGKRIGEENGNGAYIPVFDRKTNKGINDNNIRLKNALNTLNNGSFEQIEQLIDLKYFARYEAISYLVGDPDDLRNNYNNYYVYIRRTDGKMIVIPYDHDRVFGIKFDWDPSGNGMRNVPMYYDKAVATNDKQRNPLYLKTLLASENNYVKKDFENYCMALKISRWFTSEKFNKYFELAKNNYGDDYFTSTAGNLRANQIGFMLNDNKNLTFETYINDKLKMVQLSSNPQNPIDPPIQELNLYLVGDFNNWTASEEYHFKKANNNVYTLEIEVNQNFKDIIYFKINDGDWNGSVDWGFDNDLNIVDHGGNGSISGVFFGAKIDFELDITKMKLSYNMSGYTVDDKFEPLSSYDFYFAYEGNGWNDALGKENYKFQKLDTDPNILEYDFLLTSNYAQFKFKIMCSNGILYGTNDEQKLLVNSSEAKTFKAYDVLEGQNLKVTLNLSLQEVSFVIQ